MSLIKSPFLSPYQYDNAGNLTKKLEDYDFLQIANPYAILEYGVGQTQKNIFNLALQPSYKFNKSLTLSSRFSYSMNNTSENSFSPMYGVAPLVDLSKGFVSQNYVKTQFAKQLSMLSDTRINWKKNSGKDPEGQGRSRAGNQRPASPLAGWRKTWATKASRTSRREWSLARKGTLA